MGSFESSLVVRRMWSYCAVSLRKCIFFCVRLYCKVFLRIVLGVRSWFILDLVVSCTVCLTLSLLLGRICLWCVNIFVVGIFISRILFLLEDITVGFFLRSSDKLLFSFCWIQTYFQRRQLPLLNFDVHKSFRL